jgi:hypothetical protein
VLGLDDVTLEVPAGAAMALLGQNGAGKSTLVKLILGFLHPTGGRLEVLGEERVERVHGRIGYLPEGQGAEPGLTGRAWLRHMARVAGLRDGLLLRTARCGLHGRDGAGRGDHGAPEPRGAHPGRAVAAVLPDDVPRRPGPGVGGASPAAARLPRGAGGGHRPPAARRPGGAPAGRHRVRDPRAAAGPRPAGPGPPGPGRRPAAAVAGGGQLPGQLPGDRAAGGADRRAAGPGLRGGPVPGHRAPFARRDLLLA